MLSKNIQGPRTGFTLIEMLVVIAIIALLVAIITPAVNKGIRSARNSACKSNLHQIGLAIAAYSADHKGKLPSTGFYGISPYYNRDQRNFPNSLLEYLNLKPASTWSTSPDLCSVAKVFDCPGYKGPINGKCYVLLKSVENNEGENVNPWGNIAGPTGNLSSQPYSIDDFPTDTVAIRDLDFGNLVNHLDHRNALFFDLSVRTLNLDNELP